MPEHQFGRRRSLPTSTAKPAAPAPTERTRALGRLAADARAPEGERAAAVDRVRAATVATSATAGWDGFDKVAEEMSDFANFLKVTEEPQVVKILDSEPVDVYVCHWIDEIEEGTKSFRCPGQANCPLCAIGDKARKFSACFNVITLEDPQDPVLRIWECGVKIARQLKDIATDDKRGPLDRPDLYFSIVKKAKTAKNVEYTLERIRARDLQEEFGITPLTDTEIARFLADRYTDEIKSALPEEELEKIASFIVDGA
ncbi:hypothetical protein [Streptomyces sp. CBMA29]|uniref:hypothetical protein n=1 Tax=Streptomyces sp. CBMA29 TaxID=1896314 RepID=UPI00166201E6|nr:hypothetical protein [Streptomyces sp. CBMA29]MBD0734088.1 hypothetical protein [Streptomyces sp. CBMA29]